MNRELSALLVGIGGYGNLYVDQLLTKGEERGVVIKGIVDPSPEGCRRWAEVKEKGIPRYPSMQAFYESEKADLAVISSPIQYHMEQTLIALSKGSHVLCEKPVAALPNEAYRMRESAARHQKKIAIGYQWSFSKAILDLKHDILDGVLGKPLRLKSIVLWPRDAAYFARAAWAGKMKDPKGRWIRDSVANNATAHYLHNMFYLLGKTVDTSATPIEVTAELYRANQIESFDTTAVKIRLAQDVELFYYASHAIDKSFGPAFHYAFENADVYYNEEGKGIEGEITAFFRDGREKVYGNPYEGQENKLWNLVGAIRGQALIPCGVDAALPHALCIDAMHQSVPKIVDFPKESVTVDEVQGLTFVPGLDTTLKACYDNWTLPAENGASFGVRGRTIKL